MKYTLLVLVILIMGCDQPEQFIDKHEENWTKRTVNFDRNDSLITGKTYLSVYSQMFSYSQHRKYNMTGMISIRNVSETDSIYLIRADYFNTQGSKIRTYFDNPIFVLPMETIEIVIAQDDTEGGTGSNFLFEWQTPVNCPEPLFEGVMNSMQGTQGVAFTTHARRIQ